MSTFSEMAAPKSDQLNASDLAAGPIDITVTRISVSDGDQPLSLHAANIEGRPWKPCKTMMRWMSEAWKTNEPQDTVGKTIRLYCDPDVHFGGMRTGGIRISHMSHIDKEIHLQEGNRRQYKTLKVRVVKPLKAEVTPLKVVAKTEPEAEPVQTEGYDFDGLSMMVAEAFVLAEGATGSQGLKEWWETMKPDRMKAGAADRARAIEIAGMVKAKIAELETKEGEV